MVKDKPQRVFGSDLSPQSHIAEISRMLHVSCSRLPQIGKIKRTIECPLQNQFLRPQKVGFVWSVLVSSKENDRARTNGAGENVS